METKSSPTDARKAARLEIVQAANRSALARHRRSRNPLKPQPRLLSMRQVQQAVFRCRQLGLVDDATLVAAGYRAVKR